MHGGEITDRGQKIRNGFGLRRGDVDGGGRRRLAENLLEQVRQEDKLKEPEAGDQRREQRPDDDEPAYRTDRPLVRLVADRLTLEMAFGYDIHFMHFLQLPIVPNSATARSPNEK